MDFIPESNGIYALKQLHVDPDKYSSCITGWGDSFINMPDIIPFLESETVREMSFYLRLDNQTAEALFSAVEIIRDVPALKAYIWHMYYRLVTPSFSYGCEPSGFGQYFLPEYHLGERASIVFLAAALGAMAKAREKYRADGIPEEIIRDTLAVLSESAKNFHFNTGKVGISETMFGWLRLYVTGRLIQLGRFNFKLMETYPFGIVLKNCTDGRKLMLAQAGLEINSHGFCLQENDPWNDKVTTTSFEVTDDGYAGNVVSPAGFVLPGKHYFPKTEWKVILEPGDVMIDMHIPAGGGMTLERCRESFMNAFEFFSKCFPGRFKPVIISHSWIFNTQFEERMPDSNLAKLMRECYLFPFASSGQDGIFFLFGKGAYSKENLTKAPRNTSVRRVMLEILESGEHLRCGGMVYFCEDLPEFGKTIYRNQFRI